MTKRYREKVDVDEVDLPGRQGVPASFRWRGGTYRVTGVLGHWREDAGYWTGAGLAIEQRDLWRVEARNGSPHQGVYELVREADAWRLDRVWD